MNQFPERPKFSNTERWSRPLENESPKSRFFKKLHEGKQLAATIFALYLWRALSVTAFTMVAWKGELYASLWCASLERMDDEDMLKYH